MLKHSLLYPLIISLTVISLPSRLIAAGDDSPVAKIDGVVITADRIDEVLESADSVPQQNRNAALESVITQELMVRAALREGLDQAPGVVAAIETASRKILAQAYLEAQARNIPTPTAVMVQAYYDEHPALFRERALYELQEIDIQVNSAQMAAVNDHYNKVKTLNEMTQWLEANGIAHTSNAVVKAAEELPADLLEPVSQLQPGQVIKVTTDRGIAIVQLTGKRTESLTPAEAQPTIVRALANQALGAKIAEEMSELRSQADIEYYPPYAPALERD
jgi:EpsD family peptidyl-prolyl cis-trans isomerase